MKENSYLSNHSDDDVIAFTESNLIKAGIFKKAIACLFKTNSIESLIYDYLQSHHNIKINRSVNISNNESKQYTYYNKWLEEGVYCEVLRLGAKNWQKGKIKIRVSVEFCPDELKESESSLDDIRQAIENSNKK